mgnify:CR=1 FL=1
MRILLLCSCILTLAINALAEEPKKIGRAHV